MIKRLTRIILSSLLMVSVFLGLSGCSNLKAEIPHHIVTAAVTRQAGQQQVQLWSELSSESQAAPQLTVKRVNVDRVRSVKVGADLAYEVTGTYQYKLRYPSLPSVTQSQVPFDVIVQKDDETDDWRALQPSRQSDRRWSWLPLAGHQEPSDTLTS